MAGKSLMFSGNAWNYTKGVQKLELFRYTLSAKFFSGTNYFELLLTSYVAHCSTWQMVMDVLVKVSVCTDSVGDGI